MPGDLPDAVAALLLDFELTEEERASINSFDLLDLEFPIEPCPVWREHGAMLVAHFVKRHPGRRPSRWWTYDAPRRPGLPADSPFELPRMRVGGTGSALCEVFEGVEPECHLGIPREWIRTPDDLQECTEAGIAATMIDPANPPRFESQASYLKRYALLARGEARRLTPVDFEPEAVTP